MELSRVKRESNSNSIQDLNNEIQMLQVQLEISRYMADTQEEAYRRLLTESRNITILEEHNSALVSKKPNYHLCCDHNCRSHLRFCAFRKCP